MSQQLLAGIAVLLVLTVICILVYSRYSIKPEDNRIYLLLDESGSYLDSLANWDRVLAKVQSKGLTEFSVKVFEYTTKEGSLELLFVQENFYSFNCRAIDIDLYDLTGDISDASVD